MTEICLHFHLILPEFSVCLLLFPKTTFPFKTNTIISGTEFDFLWKSLFQVFSFFSEENGISHGVLSKIDWINLKLNVSDFVSVLNRINFRIFHYRHLTFSSALWCQSNCIVRSNFPKCFSHFISELRKFCSCSKVIERISLITCKRLSFNNSGTFYRGKTKRL